jgi:DNA-binding HxlR family transcriptional regulator
MKKEDIIGLLKQRPGYEVVFLLLQSDQRRKELAAYAGTDGGTLQRWLSLAEQQGFISKDTFLRNDEKHVEYSLDCSIPSELVSLIEERGGSGPRDTRTEFADTAGIHHWNNSNSF